MIIHRGYILFILCCFSITMGRKHKISKEDISKRVHDIFNGDITLIGDTDGVGVKAEFLCNRCGNTWYATPNNVMRGHGCPICSRERQASKKRISKEEIISRVRDITNGDIDIIGEPRGSMDKVMARCNVCGNEWMITPNKIFSGRGCPKCSLSHLKTSQQLSKQEIEKRVLDSSNGEISLIGDTDGTQNKAKFRCNICGLEWDALPSNVIRGHGCPRCKGNLKYTEDSLRDKISDISHGEILLVQFNDSTHNMATFRCLKCGYEWEAKPNNVINGTGCPKCARSKGEDAIERWLNKNWSKDDWVSQKKFDGLIGVGGRRLSFDFYIPSKNLCIEFQGGQHYISVDRFGGIATLEKQKEHDSRKKEFCALNKIELVEIPYNELDNIDNIMDRILKKDITDEN